MWFLTGFITLAVFCVTSLLWRRKVSWSGERRQIDGIAYEVRLTVRKGSLTLVQVGIKCADGLSFTLKRERLHDVLSKRIGLSEECQTGDSVFDEAVYILSDDRPVHRLLQTDRALRDSLLQLIDACPYGLKSLEVHQGRLWIVAKPIGESPEDAEIACAQLAPLLKSAAERLKPLGQAFETQDPFPFRAACVLAISTGLAFYGGFSALAFIPPYHSRIFPVMMDPLSTLVLAVPAGLCVFAVLALIALAWLGRSARTHLVLIELFLVGLPGAILTANDGIYDFNIDHDQAPASMIPATVVDLDIRRGGKRSNTRYRVTLEGWPTPAEQTILSVESRIYYRLQIGQPVAVEQHPGALGWPWVSGIRVP